MINKLLLIIFAIAAPFHISAANIKDPPALEQPKPTSNQQIQIMMFGDSLVAGFGVLDEQDRINLVLQRALQSKGYDVAVFNEGRIGHTSEVSARRIDETLSRYKHGVDIGIIILGGNDFFLGDMSGQFLLKMRNNIKYIITRMKANKMRVLLCGLKVPNNVTVAIKVGTPAMFEALSDEMKVPLLPFLLEGVWYNPVLTQTDRIHPNAQGVVAIVNNIMTVLEPMVKEAAAEKLKKK